MRPHAVATDKIASAVDGVDNPSASGVARRLPRPFLAKDAVVGKARHEFLDEQAFAVPVGRRHGRLVGFGLGGNPGAPVSERQFTGLPRGSERGVLTRTKRGRAYVYVPAVTPEAVCGSMTGDLRRRLFRGSMKSLILNLIDERELSTTDIAEVKAAIHALERRP